MSRYSLRYWCFQLVSFGSIPLFVFALPYLMSKTPLSLYESWPGNLQQQLQLTQEYGFDRPLLTQSGRWLHKLVTARWGQSRYSNRAVFAETSKALRLTLAFLLWAACAYSLWAGVLALIRRLWSWLGFLWQGATLLPWLQAVPAFLLAILLRHVLLRHFGWIGLSQGLMSDAYTLLNPLYMLPPACMLALPQALRWAARRLPHGQALPRHPGGRLLHALADSVRHMYPQLGTLLMEVCLVEYTLSFPGLGSLGIEALKRRDLPTLQGFLFCMAGLYGVLRVLCSLPRLRLDPPGPSARVSTRPAIGVAQQVLPFRGVWCSLLLLMLVLWGAHLVPHDPMEIHGRDQFLLPGYRYILGTDFLGRDVLSRTIKGFRSSLPRVVVIALAVGSLSWLCARLALALPRPLQALWHGGHTLLLTPMPPFLLAFMAFLVAEHSQWALEIALLVAALPLARRAFLWPMPWLSRLGHVGHIGSSILLLDIMFSFLNLSSESFMPTWGSDLRYSMQYGHMNLCMLLAPAAAIVWSRALLHAIGTTSPVPAAIVSSDLTTASQTNEPAR